jgi:hypothetical protein
LDESIQAIMADPGRITSLAAVKLARTWNPLPNATEYRAGWIRLLAGAWTIPIFFLAAGGAFLWMIRQRASGLVAVVFLLLPTLYVTGLHSLFVGSVRYRLIAMPMVEVLAAYAIVAMMFGLRRTARGHTSSAAH